MMENSLAQLQDRFGIPNRLDFALSEHGFLTAHLSSSAGSCTVSLYGGQVLETSLTAGGALFWLSPDAIYREGKAIRGGVPIVFPWFGSHPDDKALPSHGFARISHWSVISADANEHQSTLILGLENDDETRRYWNQAFSARLTTTLSPRGLSQALIIENTGEEPWTWAGGFHPYFSVANLGNTRLPGVTGLPFVDLTSGERFEDSTAVEFGSEVDRAYVAQLSQLEISDMSHHRAIVLEFSGTDSLVVWNPGLGNEKSDMPEGSASRFICVEPARAADVKAWAERSLLGPGESTELSYQVHLRQV